MKVKELRQKLFLMDGELDIVVAEPLFSDGDKDSERVLTICRDLLDAVETPIYTEEDAVEGENIVVMVVGDYQG